MKSDLLTKSKVRVRRPKNNFYDPGRERKV